MGPKKVGQRSRFNLGWHPFREFSHFLKIFFNRNLQLRVFPVIFLSSVAGVRDLTVTEIDLVSTLPRSPPLFSAYFYAFASVSRSSHNGEGNYARAWKIFRVSKRRRRWARQIGGRIYVFVIRGRVPFAFEPKKNLGLAIFLQSQKSQNLVWND